MRKQKRYRKIRSKSGRNRVSAKISHLVREGIPQRQAVAESLSMERAGRITESGGYRRVNRKRKRQSRR